MSGFLLHSKQPSIELLTDQLKMKHGNTPSWEKGDQVIYQWGNTRLYPHRNSPVVLNPAQGIKNCSSSQQIRSTLNRSGIPILSFSRDKTQNALKFATIRRYFVFVFQINVIGLYRSKGKNVWLKNRFDPYTNETFEEIEINRRYREIRKVLQYAERSIYALGLDFGGVLVGIHLSGKIKVLDVQPAPLLNKKMARKISGAFQKYLNQYQSRESRTKDVLLGADPEFVLRSREGNLVLASTFFGKKGRVGCDHIWVRGDTTRTRHPLVELRPEPAVEPRDLAINLYKSMLIALKKINRPSVEWLAGGMPFKGYPIGGHIHFSQTWLNFQFLRALDNYLSLPLLMIEDPRSFHRRPKYGYLGDYRIQYHGGFEYRTLPSWLISPTVTKGVLALARVIATSYWDLTQVPLSDPLVQKAFYEGQKNNLAPLVRSLWSDLQQTPNYAKYKEYLDPLKNLIFSQKTWNEKRDIRPSWRLPLSKKKVSI